MARTSEASEERTVRQLLDSVGADCSPQKRLEILNVYRAGNTQEKKQKDSLIKSVMAMPLQRAIRMGIVTPAIETERTPDKELTQREFSAALSRVCEDLTPNESKLVQRLFVEDKSVKEVAEEVGLTRQGVGSAKQRLVKKLRASHRVRTALAPFV